jgi:hypothetical protein
MPDRVVQRITMLACVFSSLIVVQTAGRLSAQPVGLVFSVQPPNGVAGVPLSPSIEVTIVDNGGRTERQATNSVTLALAANPGGAFLTGTLTVAAIRGVAVFNNLVLDRSAAGYTLVATSPGLTSVTSTVFSIVAGTATRVGFGPQPATVGAGTPFSPPITVNILDAFGNVVTTATNNVTVSLGNNPSGATLFGTLTRAANTGTASFADLLVTSAGAGYTFAALSPGLTGASSGTFDVTAGLPARLRVATQPTGGEAAGRITPAVQIQVDDAYGNVIQTASPGVTASLTSGPTGAILSGTTAAAGINGTATFSDLLIDRAGTGYVLTFSATGLSPASTVPFNISGGVPALLVFDPPAAEPYEFCFSVAVSPTSGLMEVCYVWEEWVELVAGTPLPMFDVVLLNASGGRTDASGVPITIVLTDTATTLSGTTSVTSVNGVAQFSNVIPTKVPQYYSTWYKIRATSGALAPQTLNRRLFIRPAAATSLIFTNSWSSNYEFGQAIQLTTEFRDVYSNIAYPPPGIGPLSASLVTNPTSATVGPDATLVLSGGQGRRAALIDKPGAAYTLRVDAAGFSTGTSPAFAVKVTPTEVAAGGSHTCAFTVEGRIFCWGENSSGQLGIGTFSTASRPQPVLPFERWMNVSASLNNSTCATRWSTRKPRCWGRDVSSGSSSATPREIPLAATVNFAGSGQINGVVLAHGNNHACMSWLRTAPDYGPETGQYVACWGSNISGATGTGVTAGSLSSVTPALVPVDRYVGVTAGAAHTCAWTSGSSGYCWGSDSNEQLGNGVSGSTSTPSLIFGGRRWRQLAAGRVFTCGLEDSTGIVHCWGLNSSAQLGTALPSAVYATIAGRTFRAVEAGGEHACGIAAAPLNTVYCWGANGSGQIGVGTVGGSSAPRQVWVGSRPLQARSISAGARHTCAVSLTNQLYCWGANDSSQLGLGDTVTRNTPSLVVFQ